LKTRCKTAGLVFAEGDRTALEAIPCAHRAHRLAQLDAETGANEKLGRLPTLGRAVVPGVVASPGSEAVTGDPGGHDGIDSAARHERARGAMQVLRRHVAEPGARGGLRDGPLRHGAAPRRRSRRSGSVARDSV
jgi:hypothetical protein